jgi:hypothetical protein
MLDILDNLLAEGIPVLVQTENQLIVPYIFQSKDLRGHSSAINHLTEELFKSCLVRISSEQLNYENFFIERRKEIMHLGDTLYHNEVLLSFNEEDRYLLSTGRIHKELDYEKSGGPNIIKKWRNMTPFEKKRRNIK